MPGLFDCGPPGLAQKNARETAALLEKVPQLARGVATPAHDVRVKIYVGVVCVGSCRVCSWRQGGCAYAVTPMRQSPPPLSRKRSRREMHHASSRIHSSRPSSQHGHHPFILIRAFNYKQMVFRVDSLYVVDTWIRAFQTQHSGSSGRVKKLLNIGAAH